MSGIWKHLFGCQTFQRRWQVVTKGSLSAEVRCRNKLKIFINSDPSGINCTPHPAGVVHCGLASCQTQWQPSCWGKYARDEKHMCDGPSVFTHAHTQRWLGISKLFGDGWIWLEGGREHASVIHFVLQLLCSGDRST